MNFLDYLYTSLPHHMLHPKASFLALALLCSVSLASAQDGPGLLPDYEIPYSVFTGGQFGISIGNSSSIEVNPVIGHYPCSYFSYGIGGGYQFYRFGSYPGYPPEHINIYSLRAFARIHPLPMIFTHAEFENIWYKNNAYIFPHLPHDEQVTAQGILLGIGYMERISDYFGSYLLVLWNFNETLNTPYVNPVFRFGIEIGL